MDAPYLEGVLRAAGIAVERRSANGWLQVRCPFPHRRLHPGGGSSWGYERNPSAGVKVNPDGLSGFDCRACHRHGRLSSMLRSLAELRRSAGLARLAERVGRDEGAAALALPAGAGFPEDGDGGTAGALPSPLVEEAYEGLYDPAWEAPEARAYLEGRGVGEAAARRLGLLFDPDRRRVLFPVRDGAGGLHGYSGRLTYATDDPRRPKVRDYAGLPKRHLLLGEHLWRRDGRPLLVVEGLFGLARLLEIGADALCDPAALLGSALTPEKAARLAAAAAPVFSVLDGDAAGDEATFGRLPPGSAPGAPRDEAGSVVEAARRFGFPLHVPAWPEGKDDPDQLDLADVEAMLSAPPYGVVQPVAPANDYA